MQSQIKKSLRPIYRFLRTVIKIHKVKTIYFNFKMLPFKEAIKLPVFIVGKVKFQSLKGKVIIKAPVKTGMIKIGVMIDAMPSNMLPVQLKIDNILQFNGCSHIARGVSIQIWGKGHIILGKYSRICSGVTVQSLEKVELGDYSWITAECIVMDSNIHYILDVMTGRVMPRTAPIKIGNYCWIIMRSTISKGTILPDYCIVARNSFLNKDYSKTCGKGSFLAGNPAIVKGVNTQYIPNFETEQMINRYFEANPNADYYQMAAGFIIDSPAAVFPDFKIHSFR